MPIPTFSILLAGTLLATASLADGPDAGVASAPSIRSATAAGTDADASSAGIKTATDANTDAGTAATKTVEAVQAMDEKRALALVSSLPEVTAVREQLQKAHVPMAVRRDDDGTSGKLQFAVAEDHQSHQVTRARFSVDTLSGEITAYEVECDLWAPLEKWRALRKKLAAMRPEERDVVDTCEELTK